MICLSHLSAKQRADNTKECAMKTEHFDTIIVGSGTSAYYALEALASHQKVAVVAPEPLGGVCALKGCQPKKYLVAHQEARNAIKDLLGHGFETMPKSSWAALQSLKNAFTASVPRKTRKTLQSKARFIEGIATFCAPDALCVGEKTLSAKHIVLATGSLPRRNAIKGSEYLRTSDDFLEMPSLPKRIAFVGAGVIAFEFAYVAASLGSDVTVVHRSNQPLKGFDESMVARFLSATKEAGIRVITNAPVTEVIKQGATYTLITEEGLHVKADAVFETIGRMPNLSVLEGDESNVQASAKGIAVNAHMQSVSNPHVYAIGDCTDTPYQLATVADEQGKIAGENILKGNHRTWDGVLVAHAMFTHPPLAAVGITEEEAKAKGLDYTIKEGETASWPSSKRIGETHGAYKMVLSKEGTLLGATLLRHNSPEVINLCAMLLKTKMPIATFKQMALAYPTASSDLKNML